jgi:hypothetical protein
MMFCSLLVSVEVSQDKCLVQISQPKAINFQQFFQLTIKTSKILNKYSAMKTCNKKNLSVNSIIRQLNRAKLKCTYLVKVSKYVTTVPPLLPRVELNWMGKVCRFIPKNGGNIPYKHENKLCKSSVVTLMFWTRKRK